MTFFNPQPPVKPQMTVAEAFEYASTGALPPSQVEYQVQYSRYKWQARFASLVALVGVSLMVIGLGTVAAWFG